MSVTADVLEQVQKDDWRHFLDAATAGNDQRSKFAPALVCMVLSFVALSGPEVMQLCHNCMHTR